jgi:hypothetical protein
MFPADNLYGPNRWVVVVEDAIGEWDRSPPYSPREEVPSLGERLT